MSEQLKKTVITVTVLSNGDYEFTNLASLAYDITDGDCSGACEVTSIQTLSREEMAEALKAQGSDPTFLLGEDEDGGHDDDQA